MENKSIPDNIREEMDADMEESGMAQGEIVSCLNHWSKKYIIRSKMDERDYKAMNRQIIYETSDGECFTDKCKADKHEYELHLKKLEIINRKSWIDVGLQWYMLAIFFAGMLIGWFLKS